MGDQFDPMKAMLLQVFLGNLASDLREGKVEETIEKLDRCGKLLEEGLEVHSNGPERKSQEDAFGEKWKT